MEKTPPTNPNWIQSWMIWKNNGGLSKMYSMLDATSADLPTKTDLLKHYDKSICPICNGYGLVDGYYCLCSLLDYQSKVATRQYFESPWEKKSIEQLKPFGNHKSQAAVNKLKQIGLGWLSNPKWLTISSMAGGGKSHLLQAMRTAIGPLAFYIDALELESLIFQGMKDNMLQAKMNIIRKAPILLLDDFGAQSGNNFLSTQFRSIINWRYNRSSRLPTVVTTNLKWHELKKADPRVASRLGDRNIGMFYYIETDDYRIS